MPFLLRRLTRVVPLYWIFTTVKILLMFIMPGLIMNTVLTPWHVASSFLFIPTSFGFPILQVGWTLSYEMLFYLLFACFLFIRVRPVVWLSIMLTILAIAGLYRTEAWWPPTILMNSLLIEFVFGMLIGFAAIKRRFIPQRFALATALVSIVALLLSNFIGSAVEPFRLLFWGIPGALLLASILPLEGSLRKHPMIKWPVKLGAASYALYLLHTIVLGAIWVVADGAKLTHGLFSYLVYAVAIVFCIVVAWFVHSLLEAPLSRFLMKSYILSGPDRSESSSGTSICPALIDQGFSPNQREKQSCDINTLR